MNQARCNWMPWQSKAANAVDRVSNKDKNSKPKSWNKYRGRSGSRQQHGGKAKNDKEQKPVMWEMAEYTHMPDKTAQFKSSNAERGTTLQNTDMCSGGSLMNWCHEMWPSVPLAKALNLKDLISSLEGMKDNLPTSDEEFGFLQKLLQSREIKALMQVHQAVATSSDDNASGPVLGNMEDVVNDVLDEIEGLAAKYREARELFEMLQNPHFQVRFFFCYVGWEVDLHSSSLI
ncbi:unnamed protein product, partial [Cyprideis torosa]